MHVMVRQDCRIVGNANPFFMHVISPTRAITLFYIAAGGHAANECGATVAAHGAERHGPHGAAAALCPAAVPCLPSSVSPAFLPTAAPAAPAAALPAAAATAGLHALRAGAAGAAAVGAATAGPAPSLYLGRLSPSAGSITPAHTPAGGGSGAAVPRLACRQVADGCSRNRVARSSGQVSDGAACRHAADSRRQGWRPAAVSSGSGHAWAGAVLGRIFSGAAA